MGRAALRSKTQVVYQTACGPTLERLARAAGAFELSGVDKASQRTTMLDRPLARLIAAKGKTWEGSWFEALRRYGEHFYEGGLMGSIGSINLESVFASPFCRDHMAKSEGQVDHRLEYQRAKNHLDRAEAPVGSKYDDATYAHKLRIVVDNVIIADWPLHVAGYSIGYSSPYRAREAATAMLRDAGYRLAKFWGIG
jgi:hypothetical protein